MEPIPAVRNTTLIQPRLKRKPVIVPAYLAVKEKAPDLLELASNGIGVYSRPVKTK